MFKRILAACIPALAMALAPAAARAGVDIAIDKSTQRMTVSVDGVPQHVWRVSTGRDGFGTPNGQFRPQRMARTWFSRKYYNSPMPHSIFFHGGYAIHGSNEISRLGGPASHGCVRLHPANAATLFALVEAEGPGSTRISVTGSSATKVARRPVPRRSLARKVIEDDELDTPAYAPRSRRPIVIRGDYRDVYAPVYVPRYAPAYGYGWDGD